MFFWSIRGGGGGRWRRGVLAGLLAVWVGLITAVRLVAFDRTRIGEALRQLPDLVRLNHRLAGDRSLPRPVRLGLGVLLVSLALPFDLVLDVVPVIGCVDDAVLVALVIRSVITKAAPAFVATHWPGTPEGLTSLYRLTRTARPATPDPRTPAGYGRNVQPSDAPRRGRTRRDGGSR